MITLIAQTATALAEKPETLLDALGPIIALVSLLWGGWQTIKASNKAALLRAAIIGVRAGLDSLSKVEAEIVKQKIETAAGGRSAPLNEALKAEVRKTTATMQAYRPDGLPHLALLLAVSLLLGAGGCVSAAAHNAALAAQESGIVLRKASVPNPAYDAKDREAYERLWGKHEEALRVLAEETK